MMLWAMDLTAETLRSESACRPRRAQNRASNPNRIYDVPPNPLFSKSLSATLPQVIENTKKQRGGGAPIGRTLPPALLPAAPTDRFEPIAKKEVSRNERQRGTKSASRTAFPRLHAERLPPSIIKDSHLRTNASWHSTRKFTNSAKKS
jgi:hypothetical protein